MEAVETAERESCIPSYDSVVTWKYPKATGQISIDFDILHEALSKKMKLNAIRETWSIEVAAKFRTNS